MCTPDLFLAVLAILFPPIAVWIKVGICSADSIINIALCCLGYLPGLIHAWYIILKHPEPDDEYAEGYQPVAAGHGHGDPEGGRVTYYYVAHEPSQRQQAHPHAQRTYGTAPPFGQMQHQQQQQQQGQVPGGQSSNQQQQQQSGPKKGREEGQAGEGSHGRPPPTYAEAVKGDHKIQDQEE